jgi:hypothetical protein
MVIRRNRPTLKITNFQDMGSHTPSEDRQARLSGAGRGYIRQRLNSRTGFQAKNEQILALDGYSRIQHPIALLYLIGHSLGVSFFIKITRRLFRIEKA